MSLVLTAFMTVYLRRENARRDQVLIGQAITLEEVSDEIKWEQREKGDDATFYRYTV